MNLLIDINFQKMCPRPPKHAVHQPFTELDTDSTQQPKAAKTQQMLELLHL